MQPSDKARRAAAEAYMQACGWRKNEYPPHETVGRSLREQHRQNVLDQDWFKAILEAAYAVDMPSPKPDQSHLDEDAHAVWRVETDPHPKRNQGWTVTGLVEHDSEGLPVPEIWLHSTRRPEENVHGEPSHVRRLLQAGLAAVEMVEGVLRAEAAAKFGREWSSGSDEPKEPGLVVQSTVNGVRFRYSHLGGWHAYWDTAHDGPADGQFYTWNSLTGKNGASECAPLVEVLEP